MRYVAHMNEAAHAYEGVLSHILKTCCKTYTNRRHVTRMTHTPESRHTREFYLRVDIEIAVQVAVAVEVQPCANDMTL